MPAPPKLHDGQNRLCPYSVLTRPAFFKAALALEWPFSYLHQASTTFPSLSLLAVTNVERGEMSDVESLLQRSTIHLQRYGKDENLFWSRIHKATVEMHHSKWTEIVYLSEEASSRLLPKSRLVQGNGRIRRSIGRHLSVEKSNGKTANFEGTTPKFTFPDFLGQIMQLFVIVLGDFEIFIRFQSFSGFFRLSRPYSLCHFRPFFMKSENIASAKVLPFLCNS